MVKNMIPDLPDYKSKQFTTRKVKDDEKEKIDSDEYYDEIARPFELDKVFAPPEKIDRN